MRVYQGSFSSMNWVVWVLEDGRRRPLDPRLDLANHSPDGFSWGYQGSGPAQTALAVLADSLGDELAVRWYQRFKTAFVACVPTESPWEITSHDIQSWVDGDVTSAELVADATGPSSRRDRSWDDGDVEVHS